MNNTISFSWLLTSLPSDMASNVRKKFIMGRQHFIPNDNKLALSLINVICSEKIINVLNYDEFGMVLDSLFPKNFLEIRWLGKYCDLIVRTLECIKAQTKENETNEQYFKEFLYRVQEFKKRLFSIKDTKEQELWQELIDIFKLATIIRKLYRGEKFTYCVSYRDMDLFEKGLRNNRVAVALVHKIDPFKQEERQYAVLISWILIEMICEQDEIESGDGDE